MNIFQVMCQLINVYSNRLMIYHFCRESLMKMKRTQSTWTISAGETERERAMSKKKNDKLARTAALRRDQFGSAFFVLAFLSFVQRVWVCFHCVDVAFFPHFICLNHSTVLNFHHFIFNLGQIFVWLIPWKAFENSEHFIGTELFFHMWKF